MVNCLMKKAEEEPRIGKDENTDKKEIRNPNIEIRNKQRRPPSLRGERPEAVATENNQFEIKERQAAREWREWMRIRKEGK